MKPTPWIAAEPHRMQPPGLRSNYGDAFGVFAVPYKGGIMLYCVVSDGNFVEAGLPSQYAWEHVSVSTKNRTPNWYEMDFIKDLFWRDDETVMQLHVPKAQHKNLHPHVLHLWRPLNVDIPLPPSDTVA